MTSIDFPDAPEIDDVFTVGSRSWQWTGSVWQSVASTVVGPTGPTGPGIEGVTATATELNVLDGATVSTAELNYVEGVTSAIQDQLDGKAATSHTHNTKDITQDADAAISGNVTIGSSYVNEIIAVIPGGGTSVMNLQTAGFSAGQYVSFIQLGPGTVSFTVDGATTQLYSFNGLAKLEGQNAMATATRIQSGFALAGRLVA
jgi:hypothetical protein